MEKFLSEHGKNLYLNFMLVQSNEACKVIQKNELPDLIISI